MKQDYTDKMMQVHKGLVYYMLSELNCRQSDEAEAVALEALWKAITTFDESKNTSFSTYACTCIRNAVYTLFRARKEQLEAEIPLEDYINVLSTETFEEESDKDYTFLYIAVDEALNSISGKKREVAQLWLECEMSATAISKEIGCSQSYASQSIKEFKVAIRKNLKHAGYC